MEACFTLNVGQLAKTMRIRVAPGRHMPSELVDERRRLNTQTMQSPLAPWLAIVK